MVSKYSSRQREVTINNIYMYIHTERERERERERDTKTEDCTCKCNISNNICNINNTNQLDSLQFSFNMKRSVALEIRFQTSHSKGSNYEQSTSEATMSSHSLVH